MMQRATIGTQNGSVLMHSCYLSFPAAPINVTQAAQFLCVFVRTIGKCRPTSARPAGSLSARHTNTAEARTGGAGAESPSPDRELQARVASLEASLAAAKHKEDETTQERNFYFSKLREIELLCQHEGVKEKWDIMQAVENILYAATEEEGTAARESAMPATNGAA